MNATPLLSCGPLLWKMGRRLGLRFRNKRGKKTLPVWSISSVWGDEEKRQCWCGCSDDSAIVSPHHKQCVWSISAYVFGWALITHSCNGCPTFKLLRPQQEELWVYSWKQRMTAVQSNRENWPSFAEARATVVIFSMVCNLKLLVFTLKVNKRQTFFWRSRHVCFRICYCGSFKI